MIKCRCVRERIVLSGALPADLPSGEGAVGVVARVGRRTVEGYVFSDGKWRLEFNSGKPVLLIALHARLADGATRRLGWWLAINRKAPPDRRGSDWEKQMARFACCELVEQPARGKRPPADGAGLDIQWIIPDFDAGAGGMMSIFRMAADLERRGHRNTFWIMGGSRHPDVKVYVTRHFVLLEAGFHTLTSAEVGLVRGDVVMATNDQSAYFARAVGGVAAKCYFVQDYEPYFYAAGTEFLLSRATYGFGFKAIVAGPWLRLMLEREGGREVRSFDIAYDPQVYFPRGTARGRGCEGGRRHIAFYARGTTPRRAVPLGLMALVRLARRSDDLMVHLFGQEHEGPLYLPFPCMNHGVLSPAELGVLYRGCDVGLVLSATNHSIIPLEMMACGLPVVELEGEQNQVVYSEGAIVLAAPNPSSIATAIETVLNSPERAERLRVGGYAHASGRTWSRSGEAVERAIREALEAATPLESTAATGCSFEQNAPR